MSCGYLRRVPFWKTGRKGASLSLVLCLLLGSLYWTYTYYPFTVQLNCPVVQVAPSPVELPLTALASFPGSGNTWTRYVVQQATGICAGAVYFVPRHILIKKGFPCNFQNGSVILIKTHHPDLSEDHVKYQRIVILLRNPFDAFRAEFNRRHSNQTQLAPKSSIKHWPEAVRQMAEEWQRSYINWMNFKGPIHVIRYENLLKDLTQELKILFQFLEIPVPLEKIKCAILNNEGKVHRKNKAKSVLHFDKDLTKLVQSKIDMVSRKSNLNLDMYTDVHGQTER